MKKLLGFTLLGLAALAAVVLVRTATMPSRQWKVDPAPETVLDAPAVAERLAKAIRFRTVSLDNGVQPDPEAFHGLHRHLEESFPKAHKAMEREVVGERSLLYTWRGRGGEARPILLMSHLDVVPVEPGTEGQWKYPPFEGVVAEGHIWGRGSLDDKVGVVGLLEAAELLASQGFAPERTVYLAFGHDEEIGGTQGAARISSLLAQRGVEIDYVLDEGSSITENLVPGLPVPAALVGIAEKGYLTLELSVESPGGHSSTPPQNTAIGILSAAVQRLENHPVPSRLSGPFEKMAKYLGPEMGLGNRIGFANLWLLRPVVERILSATPPGNANIRTTTAVTMIQGGVKPNVLPSQAKAVINFRILPGDSSESVVVHVRRTVGDPRVKVARLGPPATEPSPESDVDGAGFQVLHRTLAQVFPGAIVAPSLVIAQTDSRHYQSLARNTYRFLPIRLGPQDLSRLHGTNERIRMDNYLEVVRFFAQLIRNGAGSEARSGG
jgi:carboxypeptidase PM20D1